MISVLRGLMSGDANTNRPFISLVLLGIVDWVCILIGCELIKERQVVTGIIWIVVGLSSGLIGYYWLQIKERIANNRLYRRVIYSAMVIAILASVGLGIYRHYSPPIQPSSTARAIVPIKIESPAQSGSQPQPNKPKKAQPSVNVDLRPSKPVTVGPGNQTPTLDIVCQNLAACPSKELCKRANELADKVADIETSWLQRSKANLDTLGAEAQAKNETLKSPDFVKKKNMMMDREDWMAMIEYRKYNTDVIAMRKVLSDRAGDHNPDTDYLYEHAGAGHVLDYEQIANDLRRLAGEVLALRQ